MNPIKGIPSVLTSLNLLCGLFAILFAFKEEFYTAGLFVVVAGILDFFDGFVARMLKATSAFGRELDSLADVVTFGVAPAFIVYCFDMSLHDPIYVEDVALPYQGAYAAFLIPIFSALRLARFNIDRKQKSGFLGVPTPANALFFIGLPIIWSQYPESMPAVWIQRIYALPALAVLFSLLMVIPLPLIALKFSNGFGLRENLFKYLLIGSSAILLILWRESALPAVILLYIFISLIAQLFQSFKKS
jgi:CDP-diacylglycerol--serine O-phosphatidyltransferase